LNYRLGALGFLATNQRAGPTGGLNGVRDVIMALSFVRREIHYWQGHSCYVTLMGESAGASMVTWLFRAPEADGLFRRAILQSVGALFPSSRSAGALQSSKLLELFNASAIDDLRAIDASRLNGALQIRPSDDGSLLRDAYRWDQLNVEAVLLGVNSMDCLDPFIFTNIARLRGMLRDELDYRKMVQLSGVLQYARERVPHGSYYYERKLASLNASIYASADGVTTVIQFDALLQHICPTRALARLLVGGRTQTYLYGYQHYSATDPTYPLKLQLPSTFASHTAELSLVFNNFYSYWTRGNICPQRVPFSRETAELSTLMGSLWTSFVVSDVSESLASLWHPARADGSGYLSIASPTPAMIERFYDLQCSVLEPLSKEIYPEKYDMS